MKNTFYKVSVDDGMGGERHLAIAEGKESDIIKYMAPYKTYKDAEIYLREIQVVTITPEMANNTESLLTEKQQLESRLKEINNSLK